MHRLKFAVYVVLVFVFLGSEIAYCDQFRKDGFIISLPKGWFEIPREIIDAYEKALAKSAPNFPSQHYDYAFQLESSKNWFEHPYIIVQVKNTGRIPESKLNKMEGLEVQKEIEKDKEALISIASQIQAGKMVYDKQTKIIWMRIEANVVGIGPISALSGMVPTERGFIQVSGYSLKTNYRTYESIFRTIAISTTPEAELAYKRQWSDNLPTVVTGIDWGRIFAKTIGGAIVFGMIGLIAFLRKKKTR